MPLPKPVSDIKNDLRELLQLPETSKALKYLQDTLPVGAEKHTQTIMLVSRLGQANKAFQNGQIEFKEQQMVTANVVAAILEMTNSLTESDFESKPMASGKPPVATVPKFLIIYALKDEPHCKMLNRHLNVLKFLKKISVYNVNDGLGEGDLVELAKAEMANADYLLVLITPNLFESEWFQFVFDALGECRRMIPLLIEKFEFEGIGLEKLKSLPSMGRAVSDFANVDSAYAEIVGELKKLLPK